MSTYISVYAMYSVRTAAGPLIRLNRLLESAISVQQVVAVFESLEGQLEQLFPITDL